MEDTTEEDRYLYDVDKLALEYQVLQEKEAADRALVDTIEFPDTEVLREKLVDWAVRGFQDGYVLFSITIEPPPFCTDMVYRTLFDYIEYLAGVPISEKMRRLSSRLKSMHVECSYSGNTVTFHIFKD